MTEHAEELIKKYEEFSEETRNGIHGKTAQYWMGYVDMLHLYHEFSRSVRRGDLDLHIYCLQRITALFFTFNHQNYSRWLIVYHDKLLRLKDSHPHIYREFKDGCFSLKRTPKPFSRIPIDLTLEQTINADAACQRSGIISLTNSISARQRWAQSHSVRTSILSKLFEELGLTNKEDISEELKPHRVKKNCLHAEKIIFSINQTMNPFSSTIEKDHLFNIASGKAASTETAEFLLNVWTLGYSARDCFIMDCNNDPEAYKNPIKRQKVKNFASEAGNYKISMKNKSLVSVSMTRDLFGSILYHALQAEVDMEQILKYPLTPVPLSMSHVDGTMMKTPKSKLLEELEKRIASSPPSKIDVTIIDGMFFLHLLYQPPSTFGGLADYLLRQVCKQKGTEIHLVFDKTISPSIKDAERNKRSNHRNMAYQITGPEQKRPSNWLQALRGDQFKEALVTFLTNYWENENSARILDSKKLIVNNGDTCYSFTSQDGAMMKTEEMRYFAKHEEADTRMLYHAGQLTRGTSIVIRTIDTDVVVIALGCFHHLKDKNIWVESGVQSKNNLRYININKLYDHLGESLCKALPFYHAFTGCDYTSSFNRKGKIKPLKMLEQNPNLQEVFFNMPLSEENIPDESMSTIESFVCQMYGRKKLKSVDQARLEIFMIKYKPKKGCASLSQTQAKKLDSSIMPPCSKVLYQKINRCIYVASIWLNSLRSEPTNRLPNDFGWLLDQDNTLSIKWFDGDVAPKIIEVVKDDSCIGYGKFRNLINWTKISNSNFLSAFLIMITMDINLKTIDCEKLCRY